MRLVSVAAPTTPADLASRVVGDDVPPVGSDPGDVTAGGGAPAPDPVMWRSGR